MQKIKGANTMGHSTLRAFTRFSLSACSRHVCLAVMLLLTVISTARTTDGSDADNLVLSEDARVVEVSNVAAEDAIKAWWDGRFETRTSIELPSELEIVIELEGDVSTPTSLVLHNCGDLAETLSVELLCSTLSPDAGFRSLRSCAIKPKSKKQKFDLPMSGAKWIMFRFRSPVTHTRRDWRNTGLGTGRTTPNFVCVYRVACGGNQARRRARAAGGR